MTLEPSIVIPARASSLGAAIKILHAGGLDLSDEQMRTASSLSAYLWKQRQDEIKELVRRLSGQTVA